MVLDMTTKNKGSVMQASLGTLPTVNNTFSNLLFTASLILSCVFWVSTAGAQEAGAQEAGAQEAGAQEAGAQEAGAQEAGAQEAGAQETSSDVDAPILADVKQADAIPDSDLANEMETLKQALVNLNRDLFILEEDLLFPSSNQVAVYLSMDVGEYFKLDSVELKVDGKLATHYLYTDRQIKALYKGGVQRLYVGNVNQGTREISAFFMGTGPENRPYKRAVTLEFDKDDEAATVELKIIDSTTKQQPTFFAELL